MGVLHGHRLLITLLLQRVIYPVKDMLDVGTISEWNLSWSQSTVRVVSVIHIQSATTGTLYG